MENHLIALRLKRIIGLSYFFEFDLGSSIPPSNVWFNFMLTNALCLCRRKPHTRVRNWSNMLGTLSFDVDWVSPVLILYFTTKQRSWTKLEHSTLSTHGQRKTGKEWLSIYYRQRECLNVYHVITACNREQGVHRRSNKLNQYEMGNIHHTEWRMLSVDGLSVLSGCEIRTSWPLVVPRDRLDCWVTDQMTHDQCRHPRRDPGAPGLSNRTPPPPYILYTDLKQLLMLLVCKSEEVISKRG